MNDDYLEKLFAIALSDISRIPDFKDQGSLCLCNNVVKDEGITCLDCGISKPNINDDVYFSMDTNGNSVTNTQEINDLTPTLSMGSTFIGNKNSNLSRTQQYLYFGFTDYKEKVLMKHKLLLTKITELCKIPNFIVLNTLYKLKEFYKTSSILRGKNYLGIIAVALYYETKKHVNINCRTLIEFFNIDIKTFSLCYRMYYSNGIHNTKGITGTSGIPSLEPSRSIAKKTDILTSIINDLDVFPDNFIRLIKKISIAITDLYINKGFTTYNSVSGIIMMASKKFSLDITPETIKKITKTSIPTINKITKIYIRNEVLICNYIKYHM